MKSTLLKLLILFFVSNIAAPVSAFAEKPKKKNTPQEPFVIWINEPRKNQTVPECIQHLKFQSKLVKQDIGYCLYLPPNYAKNKNKRYPVIYNLHGNGGNEFTGVDSAALLDKKIKLGQCPEMIMVFPNGGKSTFYKNSHDGKLPIESIFLEEFIPHIDKTYRTIASGKGRCIEGFSMGGRGSTRLAMKHPEMFCSLFCQAGNVPELLKSFDEAGGKEVISKMLGSKRENYVADDVYENIKRNANRIRKNVRILIACGTKDGGHLPTVRIYHNALLKHKIDHTFIELEGLAHRRTEMMRQLQPIWFDYHVESLRRSGALPALKPARKK